jgi:cell division inhibitor SulA
MNGLKVIFSDGEFEIIELNSNTVNSIIELTEKASDISKITYPKNMPKAKKKDTLPYLKPLVKQILEVDLVESQVDTWEKGSGFGTAQDHFSDDYMKTKGLNASNEKHVDIVKKYEELANAVKTLNKSLPKGASKVGLHWHTIDKYRKPRVA